MFRKLNERERTGNPSKPIEVCYVGIFTSFTELDKEFIEKIIKGSATNANLYDVKAYENEDDAEKAILNEIEEEVSEEDDGIITPEFLETKKKEKLKPNTYWIFTVEGKPEDITKLLSTDNPQHEKEEPHEEFAKRILSATNTKKNELIIASQVREKESCKPSKKF